MLQSIKRSWHDFRRAPPGQRFERRYESRRRRRGGASVLKPLYIVLGVLLSLCGIVFLAIPGPGLPILALGGAMVAGESLRVARLLDRLDLLWRRRR